MCFGIRKSPPLHLATSILPIQNNKNPKNAINAWADTQIYPLLHHQIQYKAPLCSCGPISWGAHMKFSTMFFMNSCVSSVWKMFNKRWKVSVLQVSPISMDNTVRPPKRDDEWNITGNHTQALFLVFKNKLLNSLLTFSSGKGLLCWQTQISFGVLVQSLCSKDNNIFAALQMAVEKFVCSRMRL